MLVSAVCCVLSCRRPFVLLVYIMLPFYQNLKFVYPTAANTTRQHRTISRHGYCVLLLLFCTYAVCCVLSCRSAVAPLLLAASLLLLSLPYFLCSTLLFVYPTTNTTHTSALHNMPPQLLRVVAAAVLCVYCMLCVFLS